MYFFMIICSKLLFHPIVLSWTIDLFLPLYWVFNFYWLIFFGNQIQNVNKNKSEHIFFDQSRVTDPPPPQAQKGQLLTSKGPKFVSRFKKSWNYKIYHLLNFFWKILIHYNGQGALISWKFKIYILN